MSDQTTLLCPGQGAQAVGMGKAWFDAYPVAAQTFAAADKALGFSLSNLCFDGPAEQLNRTDMAQCAIYTASVACFQALLESGQVGKFTATAGLSLGEFTALHLAGAYDFVEGLNLVKLRGRAMQDAAEASRKAPWSPSRATSPKRQDQRALRRGSGRFGPGPRQLQLADAGRRQPARVDACERAVEAVASEMGFKPTPLTVAGAFHSPLMQPAADRLAEALDQVQLAAPPTRPSYSNVTGRLARPPRPRFDQGKNSSTQLTHPGPLVPVHAARRRRTYLRGTGTATSSSRPGKVLSGLMRRIDRGTKVDQLRRAKIRLLRTPRKANTDRISPFVQPRLTPALPSSPAPPAASAPPPPRPSPPPAKPRRLRRPQPVEKLDEVKADHRRACGRQRVRRHLRHLRRQRPRPARSTTRRRGPRPARHPRQQRRHHPRQPAHADERRGVRRGDQHQPA